METKRRVFLSFASPDRPKVRAIRKLLEAQGIDAFLDAESIRAGRAWEQELQQALEAADMLVVYWSKEAAKSTWVRREYKTFLTRWPERPCTALRVDDTPLPTELAGRQALDWVVMTNELLSYQRELVERGVFVWERRRLIRKRLRENGIDIEGSRVPWWVVMALAGGVVGRASALFAGASPAVPAATAAVVAVSLAGLVSLTVAQPTGSWNPWLNADPSPSSSPSVGVSEHVVSKTQREMPRPAVKESPVENGTTGSRVSELGQAPQAPAGILPEMKTIPAGEFLMGSPPDELGRSSDEGPQHRIKFSRAFELMRTEVTQGMWADVADAWASEAGSAASNRVPVSIERRPSGFGKTAIDDEWRRLPLEGTSWWDAVGFSNVVSALTRRSGCYALSGCRGTLGRDFQCESVARVRGCDGFRLPTEEEWEYSARGGTTAATYAGSAPSFPDGTATVADSVGWYAHNVEGGTHAVGTHRGKAHPWGLDDTLGNVWEWCESPFEKYQAGSEVDPTWRDGDARARRVVRGGSWNSFAQHVRAAVRFGYGPDARFDSLGFRLARGP